MFMSSYQVVKRERCALMARNRARTALPRMVRERGYTSMTLVTDRTVGRLHGTKVKRLLAGSAPVYAFVLPPGERSKDLRYVEQLLAFLQRKHVDRHGALVALGGGVIGDLTGFAASIYLRGIEVVQMPTSLMAQVDSAIGGKTGVDFKGIKNVVGTFYQPCAIVCDTSFLGTLPRTELAHGMAEVIKYGFIGSRTFVKRLQGLTFDRMPWEEVVAFCARAKAQVVARDPFDRTGARACLNFGHTIGHALESLSDFSLPHGKAIAIGMVAAARMSRMVLGFSRQECDVVEALLAQYGLPVRLPPRTNISKVRDVLRHDKKAKGGSVAWVLLEKIGKARAGYRVPEEVMRTTLQSLV